MLTTALNGVHKKTSGDEEFRSLVAAPPRWIMLLL
jgi:hypothetical protein